jgi:serine/threonine protein kinase
VKLADFGEAKIFTNGCTTYSGTPDYMAPEIIKMLHGKSSLLSTLHLLYSFVSPDYF